jgi:hypothetical protein
VKPGFYPDMPSDKYFSDPCPAPSLSQSIVKVLLTSSPAHARMEHPKLAPPLDDDEEEETEKYSKAKAIGDAGHKLLIGRGKQVYVGEFKNWATKEAQAAKKEALARGDTIILAKHFKVAERMVEAARASLVAAGHARAFVEGKGEVAIVTEENGLWLKALIDWTEPGYCALHDYKSTGLSAHESAIPFKLLDDEWGIQAAMQERILDQIDPENAGRRAFFFHYQEHYPPFAMRSVRLTEAAIQLGRRKVAAAIQIWRRCLETKEFPSYPKETLNVSHPDWAETKWLERELALHDAGLIDFATDPVIGRQTEPRTTDRADIMRAG